MQVRFLSEAPAPLEWEKQDKGKRKLNVLFPQHRTRYGGDACPACFFMPENKKRRPPDPKIERPSHKLFETIGVPAPSVYILSATEVISLTSLRQFTWSVVRPSSVCLYRWSAFVCLRPAPCIIIHINVIAPRLDYRIFASPITYARLLKSHRIRFSAFCIQVRITWASRLLMFSSFTPL